MSIEAKKEKKKEKKMLAYELIETRGLQTENEERTTEASYAKNIFVQSPFQNWNQF